MRSQSVNINEGEIFMKKYYVYKTTCNKTGGFYIGAHYGNIYYNDDNTFDTDCYLGSGSELKRMIQIYGRDNFSKEVLGIFNEKLEAAEFESYLIKKHINDSKLLNRYLTNETFSRAQKTGTWANKKRPEHSKIMRNKTHSEKTKEIMAYRAIKRQRIICDKCGKSISPHLIKRHQAGKMCKVPEIKTKSQQTINREKTTKKYPEAHELSETQIKRWCALINGIDILREASSNSDISFNDITFNALKNYINETA
jgi:hypothetical protein